MVAVSAQAKENQRLYQKEWVNNNRDKTRQYYARYHDLHREKLNQKNKDLRKIDPTLFREAKNRYCETPKGRFTNLKGGAKKRNLDFEIIIEDYIEITTSPCIYCAESVKKRGLDRIDNNVGYIKQNCASCCHRCNMMKREMSVKDFLGQIQRINSRLTVIDKMYGK